MLKQSLYSFLLLYLEVFGTFRLSFEIDLQTISASFTNALLKDIISRDLKANIVISPFFVERDLSLMLIASKNQTLQQLKKLLELENIKEETMLKFFENYAEELKSDAKFYYNSELQLRQTFMGIAKKYYQNLPEAFNVEKYADFKAVAYKNLEYYSKSYIPNFFDKDEQPIDQYSLILTNAIRFQAQWKSPFSSEYFRFESFSNWGNTSSAAVTMYGVQMVGYAELPEMKARALQLPFKNPKLQLLILLPDDGQPEGEWFKTIDLSNIIDRMGVENVAISLPVFQVDYGFNFKTTLINLGLSKLFSVDAELTNAFKKPSPNKIPYLYHRTILNVDEFGCDVSVSEQETALKGGARNDGQKSPDIFFNVRRPFVYALYDNGLIRLAGRIVAL